MKIKQTVEKALKEKVISLRKIANSEEHETCIFVTGKNKYILKLGNEKHLKNEYNLLKSIPKGIAPKSVFLSKSKPIFFVQEFIEGTHPKKITNEFIMGLAKTYKKLHSNKTQNIPLPERETMYSLSNWLNRYKLETSRTSPPKLKTKLEKLFVRLEPIIKKYDKSFSNRKTFSLCHNDASLANMFMTPKGIRFIDWEFGGYWLHERDLINFIQVNKLDEKQKRLFLETYGYKPEKKFYALYILFLCCDINYLLSQKRVDYKKINEIMGKINFLSAILK
jgi:thiamine kinase-like enzyme